MNRLVLLLTLFFGLCCSVSAQSDSLQNTIQSYLEGNGTQLQYQGAYDQMITLVKSQYGADEVPQAVWDSITQEKPKAIASIMKMLGAVYQQYFNAQDIAAMQEYFNLTPEGQQQQQSSFFNSETGQKIIAAQSGLSTNIGTASEYWSRDLYMTTTNTLKNLGYHPKD